MSNVRSGSLSVLMRSLTTGPKRASNWTSAKLGGLCVFDGRKLENSAPNCAVLRKMTYSPLGAESHLRLTRTPVETLTKQTSESLLQSASGR
jgi:hypothetical protein